MSRKKKRVGWITIQQIEKEIDSVLLRLQADTHGASSEGKARAATIASTYLFEFWKRSRSPEMTLEKAQAKAMEAMHLRLTTEERKEDLAQLEIELKEVQNVFENKGDLAGTVSEEGKYNVSGVRGINDTGPEGPARGSETASNPQVSEGSVQRRGTAQDSDRNVDDGSNRTGAGGDSGSAVVHPAAPEGHVGAGSEKAQGPDGDAQPPFGGSAPSTRAESTPLTILPADSSLDNEGRETGRVEGPTPSSGAAANNAGDEGEIRLDITGVGGEPSEPSVRRGWKDSSAKGRKKVQSEKLLHSRPATGASGSGDSDMRHGADKNNTNGVPDVRQDLGAGLRHGHELLHIPQEVGDMSKNFRDMDDAELTEEIERMARSKADAMGNFDGENIKEVKNIRVGKGALGTANQNVIVGRKKCHNCGFELPGYETMCVACKQPQKGIVKP